MIWLNSKREKSPSLLFALCFKKVLATLHQFASENWLSSLGTPDEMDSVFISSGMQVCPFLPFLQQKLYSKFNSCQVHEEARAKANEKPAYPPGLKPQRLAAGSFLSAIITLVFYPTIAKHPLICSTCPLKCSVTISTISHSTGFSLYLTCCPVNSKSLSLSLLNTSSSLA